MITITFIICVTALLGLLVWKGDVINYLTRPCPSCMEYRNQLTTLERERVRLLELLLQKPEPISKETEKEAWKPLERKVSWPVRQRMLEEADRKEAEVLRAKQKEIEELESQVLKNGTT